MLAVTNAWRFNQTDDLTAVKNWFKPGYDDSAWPAGKCLFYVETAALPAPKTTPLQLGRTTYYFRTQFLVPTNAALLSLTCSNLIDDGAVFYLNGSEVKRIRMKDGAVTATTLASGSPGGGDATSWDVFELPANGLKAGTNLLAVEVHQSSTNSADVVFGSMLRLGIQQRVAITRQPVSCTARPGAAVKFEVGAEGAAPLFYQWRRNGVPLSGANAGSLSLSAVAPDDFGTYTVAVSNYVSAVVSAAAVLTPPGTDELALAIERIDADHVRLSWSAAPAAVLEVADEMKASFVPALVQSNRQLLPTQGSSAYFRLRQ